MSIRFRRTKKIGGMRFSVSKRGLGVSTGVKGLRMGVGPKGTYTSAGLPGTGLYSINYHNRKKKTTGTRGEKQEQEELQSDIQKLIGSKAYKDIVPSKIMVLLIFGGLILLIFEPVPGVISMASGAFMYWRFLQSDKGRTYRYYIEGVKALSKEDSEIKAADSFEKAFEKSEIFELALLAIMLYFKNGRYDQAGSLLETYLEKHPDHQEALKISASIKLIQHNPLEAISALQLLPADVRQEDLGVITLLGSAYLEAGKPELALEVLKNGPVRKRKLDPRTAEFKYAYARALEETGDKQRAMRHYRTVYIYDPGFLDVAEKIDAGGL